MPELAQQRQSQRNHRVSPAKPAREMRHLSHATNPFLTQLQALGNQTMQRLLQTKVIQAKLTVGQPGDQYEQEADRVAEQVLRMPEPESQQKADATTSVPGLHVQRLCTACDEELRRQPEEEEEEETVQTQSLADQITPLVQRQAEPEKEEEEKTPVQTKLLNDVQVQRQEAEPEEEEEEEPLQTKAVHGSTPVVTPAVHAQINALRGGGQPLDATTRAFFEPRFGYDFSRVRIHTDARAAEAARALNAQAFTVGRDVVFGAGQYLPERTEGKRLLAHELTHVGQQGTRSDATAKRIHGFVTQSDTIQLKRATTPSVAKLVIAQPVPHSRYNIDATPTMPTINCIARISGITPDPTPNTNFDWRIRIREVVNPSSCPSSRIGTCSTLIAQNNIRGGNWTPTFNTIQGGQAVITARARIGNRMISRSVAVRIRGNNPAPAEITARCGGAGSDADRVACNETGGRRIQFFASGTPYLGRRGGDVGVMQLCNPPATCLERWSWTANVDKGLTILNRKRIEATGYLNRHTINGHYPNSLGLDDAAVLQRETWQRYNGGTYWKWNTKRKLWKNRPPNNYVAHVLACRP